MLEKAKPLASYPLRKKDTTVAAGVVIPKAMFAQKHEGGSQTEPATNPADCRKPSRGMKTRKEM